MEEKINGGIISKVIFNKLEYLEDQYQPEEGGDGIYKILSDLENQVLWKKPRKVGKFIVVNVSGKDIIFKQVEITEINKDKYTAIFEFYCIE